MKIKVLVLAMCALLACIASAEVIQLEGMVGGQYPIVMELTQHADGTMSGKYAYKSIIKKNGANKRSSWLFIYPEKGTYDRWTVKDAKGVVQEQWYDVEMPGLHHLTATMKNAQGKTFKVEATEIVDNNFQPLIDLKAYFKSNIGECPTDIKMFDNATVEVRMQGLMGYNNYQFLKSIYQTQGPIGQP